MANAERGEMLLVTPQGELVLRITVNACCELEQRSGKTFEEYLESWNKTRRITAFRWLVWLGLQHHHADIAKTPEMVGTLLDTVDARETTKIMALFLGLYSDELKALIREGLLAPPPTRKAGQPDPPTAQAVDGVDSTSTLAVSA